MEWISVKDRLPKDEVIAIGYQNETIIGYVSGDDENGFSCENDGCVLDNVTHWMPLPEPPNN